MGNFVLPKPSDVLKMPEPITKKPNSNPDMQLGDLLVSEGLINESQLKQALEIQQCSDKPLSFILNEMGLVTEEKIVEILSKRLNIPSNLYFKNTLLDPVFCVIIPRSFAKSHMIITTMRKGNELTAVMVNPLDTEAIELIEYKTGCKVKPIIITYSDFIDAYFDDLWTPAIRKINGVLHWFNDRDGHFHIYRGDIDKDPYERW